MPQVDTERQRFQQWLSDTGFGIIGGDMLVLLESTWRAAKREGLLEAAKIAEHFANDALTKEEWPPHGLTIPLYRCGDSQKHFKRLAKAIREAANRSKP